MSGGEVALFDREPSLGYPTAEPSLRAIVARYYGAHFPADEAAQFADQYFAALAPNPPAAASEGVREALAIGLAARDKFLIEEDANDQIGAFNTGALAFLASLSPAQPEVEREEVIETIRSALTAYRSIPAGMVKEFPSIEASANNRSDPAHHGVSWRFSSYQTDHQIALALVARIDDAIAFLSHFQSNDRMPK